MKKVLFLFISIGLFLLVAILLANDKGSYKVIVNAANPTSVISREQLSKFFLKKLAKWNNGKEVHPLDLADNSAVRKTFTKEIHKKRVWNIKAYWQNQIFTGRKVPPPEIINEKDMVMFVGKDTCAIGYVSASLPIDSSRVKVLIIKKQEHH